MHDLQGVTEFSKIEIIARGLRSYIYKQIELQVKKGDGLPNQKFIIITINESIKKCIEEFSGENGECKIKEIIKNKY